MLPLLVLILVLALLPMAQAVRIPFTNCLSDDYRLSTPKLLQWTPLYADASFDTESDSHRLLVTIWGNVSGSVSGADLPDGDSSYWTNPNETEGKIVRTPDPDGKDAKATTLYRRVGVLTYQPWSHTDDFCTSGLVNGTCPLSPVFDPDV